MSSMLGALIAVVLQGLALRRSEELLLLALHDNAPRPLRASKSSVVL